jgi:hypothetical protein
MESSGLILMLRAMISSMFVSMVQNFIYKFGFFIRFSFRRTAIEISSTPKSALQSSL